MKYAVWTDFFLDKKMQQALSEMVSGLSGLGSSPLSTPTSTMNGNGPWSSKMCLSTSQARSTMGPHSNRLPKTYWKLLKQFETTWQVHLKSCDPKKEQPNCQVQWHNIPFFSPFNSIFPYIIFFVFQQPDFPSIFSLSAPPPRDSAWRGRAPALPRAHGRRKPRPRHPPATAKSAPQVETNCSFTATYPILRWFDGLWWHFV